MPPHPCFDMKKIAKLPIRLRRLVEGVFDDRSAKSLGNLFIISDDLDVQEQTHFLPVLYKVLDPPPCSAKPTASRSADEHEQLRRCAVRGYPVLKSLQLVCDGGLFPRLALADVWGRVWACMMIQSEYRDGFTADGTVPVGAVWELHLLMILSFGTWTSLSQLSANRIIPRLEPVVADTPRLRQFLTGIWAHMVHDKETRQICGPPMGWFFGSCLRTSDQRTFADMVTGAGGTILDLSALVIKHLKVAAADIRSSDSDPKWILQSVTFLVPDAAIHTTLLEFLAAQGLVETLVSLSSALHTLEGRIATGALVGNQMQIADMVNRALCLPGARPWIVDGLRAGLLNSTALCTDGAMRSDPRRIESFNILLGTILPGHLTSYSVVSRLEKALTRLDNAGLVPRFMLPPLRDAWTKLKTLADERIDMKTRYDHDAQRSQRMCDGLKCNKIMAKTALRRCTQCLSMYYCSPECQRTHWTSGEHREVCRRLPKKGGMDTSTRETAFLRFLLHADYLSHKHRILSLRAEYLLSDNATTHPFYVTEFDYSSGPLQLRVLPAKPFITTRLPRGAARLAAGYQLRRVMADREKMTLDVAVVANGSEARCWVFPMRSTSPVIYNGLRRLVREKAAGLDQYDEMIRELSEASGFEEVH
ncbi:hypothetical protein C8R46DRAFT_1357172 [Mycena filopes]|nr:hypothetical protein C8R46DRAFT_1357172 [Mycena filopes]